MHKTTTPCPFCGNQINVLFREGVVSSRIVRNSTSRRRDLTFHPEKYEVIEDCPHCNNSMKELQKALDGILPSKPKSKEDLKKQLEDLGMTGKF